MSRVPEWVWIVLAFPTIVSLVASGVLAIAGAVGRRERRRPRARKIDLTGVDPQSNAKPPRWRIR